MRRLLLLLLLAGCDGSDNRGEVPPSKGAPPVGAEQAVVSPADRTAAHRQKAEQALAAILADPGSARYSDLRAGAAGAVCGRVDARQAEAPSGPRPFVVTPEGVGVISTTAEVMFEDAEDVFPDYYIRWCAAPEELRRIAPRIATGRSPDTAVAHDAAAILETLPDSPPAAVEQANASTAPPPIDEDSFSRAVMRNGSDGAAR